jgi:hypothetical protein
MAQHQRTDDELIASTSALDLIEPEPKDLAGTIESSMAQHQRTYDELIASTSALDLIEPEPTDDNWNPNIQTQNKGPILSSSGSIDDFLVEYQHEDATIIEFMTSLDEPQAKPASAQSDSFAWSDAIVSSRPMDRQLMGSSAASRHVDDHPATIRSGGKSEVAAKVMRVKMTAECKAERRKEKNREYQRRFREKKLRMELQQAFMMQPGPYGGCLTFH